MFNCCWHGTLPHFRPHDFHVSNCYFHQDQYFILFNMSYNTQSKLIRTPPYIPYICMSVFRFSAIHFRGLSIRQVSFYTLLSGFRLPWPPSCCYNRQTLFVICVGKNLSTVMQRKVHSLSPVLLTKTSPFVTSIYSFSIKKKLSCPFIVWE